MIIQIILATISILMFIAGNWKAIFIVIPMWALYFGICFAIKGTKKVKKKMNENTSIKR